MSRRRPDASGRQATPAPLLQALAHVGETDLRQGLGPERFAALARLTGEADVPRRRRWRLAAIILGLLAGVALATVQAG